jgi:hypothetical protein
MPIVSQLAHLSAQDLDEEKEKKTTITRYGMGSFEFGQIVQGQYKHAPAPHVSELYRYWMQKALLQIGMKVKHGDYLSVILAGEGMLHFPYALPSDGGNGGYIYYTPRTTWYFHYALARLTFGAEESPLLRIGIGFFPFKYNKDGHNFGEYFFRMSTYPAYMPTSFDTPYQRLVGLHLTSWLTKDFRQDLMLTSEIYLWPLKDFSLTYLANYNIWNFVEVGAGVMGHRCISVEKSLTTPPESTNPNGFTFRGVKLMAKLAFDFKRFIPFRIFGKNDLRLYGEVCLNGIEDYPIYDTTNILYPGFDDFTKRLPAMFGFNIPTCNILDRLSLELEYWESDFANAYTGVYLVGYAQPPDPVKYSESGHRRKRGTPWYWSIFAQKTLFDHLIFKLQFARDHTVIETSQTGISTADPQEAMDGLGDWSWMCKIEYNF